MGTPRRQQTDNEFIVIYCGRESGDVTGILIRKITRFIKDIENDQPDVRLVVQNGKFKVVHLIKAIREKAKKGNTTLGILIKQLEEAAQDYDLEANIGGGCATLKA